MKDKLNFINWQEYLRQAKDVRVIGQIVFGIVVVLVTYNGVGIIETNYALQKQIARSEQEVEVARLRNENQKLKNTYYESSDYLELTARRQFNRAAPGETLVAVPELVAYARAPELTKKQEKQILTVPKPSQWQQNIQSWMDFFLGRQGTSD